MDINQCRKDTKGCHHQIHFNNAGAALMPSIVVKKMVTYIKQEELAGGYELARHKAKELEKFYTETAKLLHCKPQNIAFTYHATEAYTKALSAIPFQAGNTILTSNDDYVSNQIAFLALQKRLGVQLVRAANLPNGDIDIADFEAKIRLHKPVLVAITHIPTNSGLIQPAEAIGQLCKKYKIWYLLDACQSVGQMDVNVKAIGCDFLSATGRKWLRGPRGTGFLYISDKALMAGLEPLYIDMRGANWTAANTYAPVPTAKRFECWEINYSSLVGLTTAIRYANRVGIKAIQTSVLDLASYLREQLGKIADIQVLDKGTKMSGIVTFHVKGKELSAIQQILDANLINYSVSTKEVAIIDFENKGVEWAIRLSPHYYNTKEEVDKVVDVLLQAR